MSICGLLLETVASWELFTNILVPLLKGTWYDFISLGKISTLIEPQFLTCENIIYLLKVRIFHVACSDQLNVYRSDMCRSLGEMLSGGSNVPHFLSPATGINPSFSLGT